MYSSSTLLEDAESAIEKLTHQEVQLVKESEDLFKRQVEHIRLIDNSQSFIPDMGEIDVETKKLLSLVDSSSTLVQDVCSKVRRIDSAKARLEDCLKKVSDILDLRTCKTGVYKAMELKNYEETAMHIKRYLSMHQGELQKTVDLLSSYDNDEMIFNSHSINLAFFELDEARERLLQLCRDNLTKAIHDKNYKDIERFFKIFPMLNEHQDGLTRYAVYLQGKIVNPLVEPDFKSKKTNQADKLAALYESIAKLVDSNQPLVETYYGPGHLIVVVRVIQKECDRISRTILEEFRNETKLQYVARSVRSSSLQTPIHGSSATLQNPALSTTSSELDLKAIDNILNEITLIVSRSELYLNFIVHRIKQDISFKSEDQSSLLELYNLVCVDCELNHLVQEVGGIYVMLEQYYLNEFSKKALLEDRIDPTSSYFVSSMLKDIFDTVKWCTERAISTKSIELFCAIINHCVTVLESMFCQKLQDKLRRQQYYSTAFTTKNLDLSQAYSAIQSGRYLQSASELRDAKAEFFSALNNLDKACDYIKTFRRKLDSDVKKLKPSPLVIDKQQDNQIEKSVTCLNELSQLVDRFSSIVNSSLYQLFNASLRNRMKSELKTILIENPDLTTMVSGNPNELTSLANYLLNTIDKTLQDSLTVDNYSKLTVITKEFLASSLIRLK